MFFVNRNNISIHPRLSLFVFQSHCHNIDRVSLIHSAPHIVPLLFISVAQNRNYTLSDGVALRILPLLCTAALLRLLYRPPCCRVALALRRRHAELHDPYGAVPLQCLIKQSELLKSLRHLLPCRATQSLQSRMLTGQRVAV